MRPYKQTYKVGLYTNFLTFLIVIFITVLAQFFFKRQTLPKWEFLFALKDTLKKGQLVVEYFRVKLFLGKYSKLDSRIGPQHW